MTWKQLAVEVRQFATGYHPHAPEDMVNACIPILIQWIKVSGPAFADASELPTEEPTGRRRRRRRGSPADRRTRLVLTNGLYRSCLRNLGVPASVIEQIVPGRPSGVGEWITRVFSWLTPNPVPAEWKPHNESALAIVSYVRNNLRHRPGDIRELAQLPT